MHPSNHLTDDRRPAGRRQPGSFRFISTGFFILLVIPVLIKLTGAAPARAAPAAAACQPFTQVNDPAFGIPSGTDYAGEEGFEVAAFNDQLYLGMEADSSLGARLWRTRRGVTLPQSQADWEEVIADANGKPYGLENQLETDHIDSLAAFNGYLYASNANGGGAHVGTHVYRSPSGDPGTWENALASIGNGFGDANNINFKDMQVFQGQLCGGTQNVITGAQVWCTADGTTWTQKNTGGFGSKNNYWIYSGYVYNESLYFGLQSHGRTYSSSDDVAKLFRTSDISGRPNWTEVYGGEAGSTRVDILGDLNGYLYISERSPQGVVIYRSPTGGRSSWEQVNLPGMDGSAANANVPVDGAVAYGGLLYAAVGNLQTGFELWRTSGALQGSLVDWEQVDASGLGNPQNVLAQLVVYHDQLFAWVTNYATGQRVLRASCLEGAPQADPTATPTPTFPASPTAAPTSTSTPLPSPEPTQTAQPSAMPTMEPTAASTPESSQTAQPSATPTLEPTSTSTPLPSLEPAQTTQPSATPTLEPTAISTSAPTQTPQPSVTPTSEPTQTSQPSATPTPQPTSTPLPSLEPTQTTQPSATPTSTPTVVPGLCLNGDQDCSETGPTAALSYQVFLPFIIRSSP